MVFEFLKNFHRETLKNINDEWDAQEPARLHKQAFNFLQKEFGAFPNQTFNSQVIKNQTELACMVFDQGGSVYDVCYMLYFGEEIRKCLDYEEAVDAIKMHIYDCLKHYYQSKYFNMPSTYSLLDITIPIFEDRIRDKFPFQKFEILVR